MGWQDIITDPEDVKQVIADTKEPLFLVYYADVSLHNGRSIACHQETADETGLR